MLDKQSEMVYFQHTHNNPNHRIEARLQIRVRSIFCSILIAGLFTLASAAYMLSLCSLFEHVPL